MLNNSGISYFPKESFLIIWPILEWNEFELQFENLEIYFIYILFLVLMKSSEKNKHVLVFICLFVFYVNALFTPSAKEVFN